MTTTETNNKLIAEFMGYKLTPCNNGLAWDIGKSIPSHEHLFPLQGVLHTGNELNFHTSWNWLMPVVEKIESFEDENRCAKYNVNMLQCWVEIINNDTSEEIVEAEGINKLQATYHAVIEFIKWYDKNK